MERNWVVSAFVDMRGFGTWIYRASIPKEIKEPFIQEYLDVVQRYVVANPTDHFKYLGDGFLVIREIGSQEKKADAIFKFIKGLCAIRRKIAQLIQSCPQPPDGVRVRISEGYAYKFMVIDPNDADRKRLVPEFIEYGINTAERLMEVNPEINCIVTESVGKSLGPHRSFFRMRKLGAPSCYPKGVNREDLETLEILRF